MTPRPRQACGPLKPPRGGFTLIEVLAASLMLAVLAGSLYAMLHMGFKARDTAVGSLELTRRCAAAMELMRQDIQSAAGPNGTLSGTGTLAGTFVCTKAAGPLAGTWGDSMSFYASVADDSDRPMGDIRLIDLTCESGTDGQPQLVRRVTDNLLAPVVSQPPAETLCRPVRSFAVRCFDGTNWLDGWDSSAQSNVMPKAVEITLELADPASPRGDAAYRMTRVMTIACGQGTGTASITGTAGGTASVTP